MIAGQIAIFVSAIDHNNVLQLIKSVYALMSSTTLSANRENSKANLLLNQEMKRLEVFT